MADIREIIFTFARHGLNKILHVMTVGLIPAGLQFALFDVHKGLAPADNVSIHGDRPFHVIALESAIRMLGIKDHFRFFQPARALDVAPIVVLVL